MQRFMYDRRYPDMEPVERSTLGMDPIDRKRATSAIRKVCDRTGTRAFYDRRRGSVLFVYGNEPHGGPMSMPLDSVPSQDDIDTAVGYIQLGKVGRKQKEVWAAQKERHDEHEKNDAVERHLAERRPDALSYAQFLDEKRRGVQKVSVTL